MVRLGERSFSSAVQDGAGASTRKLEQEDDLRSRMRKLEEELRALDEVRATVDAACFMLHDFREETLTYTRCHTAREKRWRCGSVCS